MNILISNYINNPILENYIPGKIFEYILCGKPIVMGGKGEVKKIIEKFDAGISVEPGNILKLKMAIYAILSNDITQCAVQEVLDTEIIMTIVSGKVVHNNY